MTTSRWRWLLADSSRLRLDQADLAGALRCTIGVLIPLLVGLATGAVADGLAAAVGALCAGFASFQGAYRSRAALTLAVAAGMSLATVTGALAARADWSAIAVVALWGALAGMMTSLGQAWLVVSLQWGVAVIIVNALPMTPEQALVRGAMVLVGGALQTVLVVLAWPVGSFASERRAVSAAFSDLSAYAAGSGLGAGRLPDGASAAPTTLSEARRALADPQPFGHPDRLVAFQALVDEAHRLRVTLVSLASLAARLPPSAAANGIEQLFDAVSSILASVASSISSDSPVPEGDTARLRASTTRASEALGALPVGHAAETTWLTHDAGQTVEALAGQLRGVLRTVAAMHGQRVEGAARAAPARARAGRRSAAVRDALVTLRSNMSWRSGVFRHAMRLAVTLCAAMVVYRVSGLSHGYWIVLTALIVLRPDFSQTLVRGVSRVTGTIVGAGLATLLAAALNPGHVGLTVMFACSVMLAFVLVRVNYAMFSVCVTSYVVFLLAFAALPAVSTAGDRVISTLIGGGLAAAAYLAWPTWESELVGARLGTLLDAQASYAELLLGTFSHPTAVARRRLEDARSATRLARSNAEVSVQQMAAEPRRSRRLAPLELASARGVATAARRLSVVLITLHAHLPAEDDAPLPQLEAFTTALTNRARAEAEDLRRHFTPSRTGARVDAALGRLRLGQTAEKTGAPAVGAPWTLRAAHRQLAGELAAFAATSGSIPRLLAETDEMVDVVNSISDLLRSGE
ncbi:MAG: FUSC family protein [Acidimicrobiales bacterium]